VVMRDDAWDEDEPLQDIVVYRGINAATIERAVRRAADSLDLTVKLEFLQSSSSMAMLVRGEGAISAAMSDDMQIPFLGFSMGRYDVGVADRLEAHRPRHPRSGMLRGPSMRHNCSLTSVIDVSRFLSALPYCTGREIKNKSEFKLHDAYRLVSTLRGTGALRHLHEERVQSVLCACYGYIKNHLSHLPEGTTVKRDDGDFVFGGDDVHQDEVILTLPSVVEMVDSDLAYHKGRLATVRGETEYVAAMMRDRGLYPARLMSREDLPLTPPEDPFSPHYRCKPFSHAYNKAAEDAGFPPEESAEIRMSMTSWADQVEKDELELIAESLFGDDLAGEVDFLHAAPNLAALSYREAGLKQFGRPPPNVAVRFPFISRALAAGSGVSKKRNVRKKKRKGNRGGDDFDRHEEDSRRNMDEDRAENDQDITDDYENFDSETIALFREIDSW